MPSQANLLIVNGGSSSVKFAVFDATHAVQVLLRGQIEAIGKPGTTIRAQSSDQSKKWDSPIDATDHKKAAAKLFDWLVNDTPYRNFSAIGHRLVHGGLTQPQHQRVTPQLLAELHASEPLDLAHLPRELAFIDACAQQFPDVPQVACFDTVFHANMPRVAQLLPIPRSYLDAGVRRFGFHGLSYAYLTQELSRLDSARDNRRTVMAHLGSGSSMAAVLEAKSIDTSMAFTPQAGIVMATRPGDLDPGFLVYAARSSKLSAEDLDDLITNKCGLFGVSGGISDMRDLLERRVHDSRAAEAVDLFCYTAKKMLGAYAAVLGGLDTLVFSGGIGEHSPEVRAGICTNMDFLGITLDPARNQASAAIISSDQSRVTVRVIPTDEESMAAQIVSEVLNPESQRKFSDEC